MGISNSVYMFVCRYVCMYLGVSINKIEYIFIFFGKIVNIVLLIFWFRDFSTKSLLMDHDFMFYTSVMYFAVSKFNHDVSSGFCVLQLPIFCFYEYPEIWKLFIALQSYLAELTSGSQIKANQMWNVRIVFFSRLRKISKKLFIIEWNYIPPGLLLLFSNG